jgi:hypothetical protein
MKENLQHSCIEVKHKPEKFSRVSRFFHKNHLKILAEKTQQEKDSYAKRILGAYGLCQLSDHIEDKHSSLTQERPSRNYLMIDRKKFEAETNGLTACEKLLIISLASASCRDGKIGRLLIATHEIKNLLSRSMSKTFIKVAMRCLIDLGLIGVIRKGRFRWQGHTYSKSLISFLFSFFRPYKTAATLFSSSMQNQPFLVSESQKNLNTSINGPPALMEASKDCSCLVDDHFLKGYMVELYERESRDYQINRPRKWVNLKRNAELRKRFIIGGINKNWERLKEIGFSETDRYWNQNILGKFLDELVIRSEDLIRNPVRFFISSYLEHKRYGQDKKRRRNWAFDNFIKSVNAMTSTARYEKTIHIDRYDAEKYFEEKAKAACDETVQYEHIERPEGYVRPKWIVEMLEDLF